MKKLIISFTFAIALCGCGSLNTTAFNTEKLLADTAIGSVHNFNIYYSNATNGLAADKLAALNARRDEVYDASRKLSAALAVTEATRIAYSTNASPANKVLLQSAVGTLSVNSSNVTNVVANAMSPVTFTPLPVSTPPVNFPIAVPAK